MILKHHNLNLIIILTATFIFRCGLVFSHDGYLGVDGGAYLLSVHAVLNDGPSYADFPRPPLAPAWLLVPFIELWGIDYGFKIWTVIASMLPIPAVYLLTRKFLSKNYSLLAMAFVAIDPFSAEMLVTGALPMIGMALYLVLLWGILDLHQNKLNFKNVFTIIVSLGLIPFVNQTMAGITFVMLPIICSVFLFEGYFDFWNKFNYKKYFSMFGIIFIGGLIGCLALPYYLQVLPNSELISYEGPKIYFASDGVAWLGFILSVPLGFFLMFRSKRAAEKIFSINIIILGILAIFLSYDEAIINIFYRSRFLLRYFYFAVLIWFFIRLKNFDGTKINKFVPATFSIFGIFILIYGFVWTFNAQSEYSKIITEDSQNAIDLILQDQKFQKNIISNAYSLSLWVSALTEVESPHIWTSRPPKAHVKTDELTRCVLNWVNNCDINNSINELNVSHILIDTRFPFKREADLGIYLAPKNHWAVTDSADWLTLVYESGTTLLYQIEE